MDRWMSLALLGSLFACGDKDEYVPEPDPIDSDRDGYAVEDDCDDFNATINPGAVEVCDEIDNNCNGTVDENAGREYFLDEDGDGYGLTDAAVQGCLPPESYVEFDGDCDDTNENVNPGQLADGCDSLDNDCDGTVDENVGVSEYGDYYIDADGDGYGSTTETIRDCRVPDGYSADATDCDDNNIQAYPGAPERCNEVDDNCNGVKDDSVVQEWYADTDGDGYGDPDNATDNCDPDAPYIVDDTDCDDAEATTNPLGVEFCDTVDNNCNSDVDEHSCYTDWSGQLFFEYGRWTVPKQRDCELYWTTTGTRLGFVQSDTSCPFCEFAFEVDYDYDSANSTDNGTCKSFGNILGEPLMDDFTYQLAYTSTLYGYVGYESSYISYVGYWIPLYLYGFETQVNAATGEYEMEYGYEDLGPYYGTYYTYHGLDTATLTTAR